LTVAFPDGVTEEDENGNLPIHVAALGNFPSIHMTWPTEAFAADMEAFSGTAKSTIAILLEADPTSARRRNRQGKFPLQLAIESGRDWGDGIGTLADAFLAAIGDRDKESGLDLCMLAAAEDCSLTVIYNLAVLNCIALHFYFDFQRLLLENDSAGFGSCAFFRSLSIT
jgi:ankyrin repeat protein